MKKITSIISISAHSVSFYPRADVVTNKGERLCFQSLAGLNEQVLIIRTQAIHFMFENQPYKNSQDP